MSELRKSILALGFTDAWLEEELRKSVKNVSLRIDRDTAMKLIYLKVRYGTPKAAMIKRALDESFARVWNKMLESD